MAKFWNLHPPYPKVYLEIACSTEFSIAHLKRYGHPIIFVELLMEALSRVGTKLDIMRYDGWDEAGKHKR